MLVIGYVEHNNISISDTGELYIILISPQGAGAVGTYSYIDDLSVKNILMVLILLSLIHKYY